MTNGISQTTIYLDSKVKAWLKHESIDKKCTMSTLINREMAKLMQKAQVAEMPEPLNEAEAAFKRRDPELYVLFKEQGWPLPKY